MMQNMLDLPAKLFLGKGIIGKRFPFLLDLYKKVYSLMAKKGEVKVNISLGMKLLVSARDCGLGMYLRTKGEFEPIQTKLFLDALKPGMTVFDIGANVGYYTILASRKVGKNGKVFAFEPDPQNLKLLYKNLALNNCQNVQVIPRALTSKVGEGFLSQDLANPGESTLANKSGTKPVKVKTTTLDRFIKQNEIKKVDLVKIDIEGAEIDALEGGKEFFSQAKGVKLFIEANQSALAGFGKTAQDLVGQLNRLGFQARVIINEFTGSKSKFSPKGLDDNLAESSFVTIYGEKKSLSNKKEQPLVSVLMTAFNAEKFVKQALESIINQTYPNLEIIVVDDGSTDRTYQIIKDLALTDTRIKAFRLKKNVGPSLASNFGLKKANGLLIARMDADDIAFPDRIERQVEFLLKNPQVVVVGGQCLLIDEENNLIGEKKFPTAHQPIYKSLFSINPIQHPTCMINRALLPKEGVWYHNHLVLAHDLELVFELAQYGQLANLPETVLYYRQYPNSLSLRNPKKTFRATFGVRIQAIKKYGYKPSFRAIMVNLLQLVIVNLLPTGLVYPLFTFWRGIRPLRVVSSLISPSVRLGHS